MSTTDMADIDLHPRSLRHPNNGMHMLQKQKTYERNIIGLARQLLDKRDNTILEQEKVIGRVS